MGQTTVFPKFVFGDGRRSGQKVRATVGGDGPERAFPRAPALLAEED